MKQKLRSWMSSSLPGCPASFPTVDPHQTAAPPAAFSQSLCQSVSDDDASDSSTMTLRPGAGPSPQPAPSVRLLCEQTRSPGSTVPEPTSPILWLWLVQLSPGPHKGREMCDCLWFHLGKRSSAYTAPCSVSPSTRAGSFQIDRATYFDMIFLAWGSGR